MDNTPSPLDGLTAMGQGTPVFVPSDKAEPAELVIEKWLEEKVEEE